jgi:protein-tyrosine-phosphatase
MAEAFTNARLGKATGARVHVASAGLEAEEGQRPPFDVVAVMKEYGLDISAHAAHKLQAEDVESADLILTMAKHNSQRMLTIFQEAVDKIFTLKEFVIRGLEKAPRVEDKDPEKRLAALRPCIRRVAGFYDESEEMTLNQHLSLFMLHYFSVYDHTFTIDDPLGQSMDFMRRTAEDIRNCVEDLMGPGLLGISDSQEDRGPSTKA